MGYDSKSILNDIHTANPLPSVGKINKHTKINNANKSLDAGLTDDQYNAAKFIFDVIVHAYDVKPPKELYNPKSESVNSDALNSLVESSQNSVEPTSTDNLYRKTCIQFFNDNKDMDFIYANRVLQFYGYNIDDLFIQLNVDPPLSLFDGGKLYKLYLKDTQGQTSFIRSANNLLSIKVPFEKKFNFKFIENEPYKKTYEGFKNIFPEVDKNFKNKRFNDDVKTGVDLYVVNSFIDLIGKVIKHNNKPLVLEKINIPKDLKAPEKENALNKGKILALKFGKTKIGSFMNKAAKSIKNVTNSMGGVASLARRMTESTLLKDSDIQAISEKHPEFSGKTFKILEEEWKTEHCKELDKRDSDFISKTMSGWKTGFNLKKYWDETVDLTTFFDVISRQLFYLNSDTDKEPKSLYEYDEKLNWLWLSNDDKYSNYINIEDTNRQQDQSDLDSYNGNRESSNIDEYIGEYYYNKDDTEPDPSEVFENNFPTVKEYSELAKIVDLISSSKPLEKVFLNNYMGNCYPTQDIIDKFVEYKKLLTPENQESYRWQIYEDLSKLLCLRKTESIKDVSNEMYRFLKENF